MFRSCVHTHTHFCDGKDAPEAMVLAAIDQDFLSLGFSGHCPADYDVAAMTPESELAYRQEIRRLQQVYGDRLEILLGLEHDAYAPYSDFPYDYQIESVHHIWVGDTHCFVDWDLEKTNWAVNNCFGGDYYAYSKYYFSVCTAAYEKSPAQIAGHLDLLTKFNEGYCLFDETDPRYLEPAKEAMACAVERGMVVELNSGAISRGYRTMPYPSKPLLRHLKDIGGSVIVTSDCHNKDYLTCFYPEAAELLRECGFSATLRLRKSGFEEVPL